MFFVYSKNTLRRNEGCFLFPYYGLWVTMVEPRGIEPLSENPSSRLSPSAVYLLRFPSRSADKQAMRVGIL